MSRWRCGGCETLYALRLSICTRCQSTTFEEEDRMAKISRNGGPSIRHVGGTPVAVHAHTVLPTVVERVAEPEPAVEEQEVTPSPGSSSSASPPRPPTSSAPSATADRKPARTTASRSAPGRKGSSSARTTGGSGTGSTDA